jgi:hypothetical protein
MINARREAVHNSKSEITRQTSEAFPEKSKRRASDAHVARADEVIRSLSDAYENQRARQVFEWETIRRRNFSCGV